MKSRKYNPLYFLVRDILPCVSYNTGVGLTRVLNSHLISKKAVRQILKDEIAEKKPQFRMLLGGILLEGDFLRQYPQSAFYEVIDLLNVLEYCFKKDSRITIKKSSATTILRLFAVLYFELIIIPLTHEEDKIYIDKFKNFFSKDDMVEIIKLNGFWTRIIFEQHGIDLGFNEERKNKLELILNEFYS